MSTSADSPASLKHEALSVLRELRPLEALYMALQRSGLRQALAQPAFQAKDREEKKKPPPRALPGLSDFLAAAEAEYGFRPERIPEQEFKVRYAREAVAHGLTGDQVVRVYALETSGLGTAAGKARASR